MGMKSGGRFSSRRPHHRDAPDYHARCLIESRPADCGSSAASGAARLRTGRGLPGSNGNRLPKLSIGAASILVLAANCWTG